MNESANTERESTKMESNPMKIAQQIACFGKAQSLMRYVNIKTLREEFVRQDKNKAKGIDNVDKEQYGKNLTANLEDLLAQSKSFTYYPKPSRRTYIPKAGSNKMRPLGIPCFEDKLMQGVLRRVLDEIYEPLFLDCSYGFRTGRNCHQAIVEVNNIVMDGKTNYVVDADIKGFFDNIDHDKMIKLLKMRIDDSDFLEYMRRFLKAGYMEDLKLHECDRGTPQGGLISPVLANVFLHHVLDLWFKGSKDNGYFKGEAHMIRYADDFVCFFQYKSEAENFYIELEKRLARAGLELSKEKSKILPFGRFAESNSKGAKTQTFDFLGFTFVNGKSRSGKYRLHVKTSEKKLKIKRQVIKKWIKSKMHVKFKDLIHALNRRMAGHYQYYGVSGNYRDIHGFYHYVETTLYKWLKRRSQKSKLNWETYNDQLKLCPIKLPKICVDIWGKGYQSA